MTNNYSMYGLPEKVEFCKLCVMSNQKPNPIVEFKNSSIERKGIHFKDGICAACTYAKMKEKIDWDEREKDLEKILLDGESRIGSAKSQVDSFVERSRKWGKKFPDAKAYSPPSIL